MTSAVTGAAGQFIWATRGRTWGFRFLRTAGFTDPLPAYDAAFADAPAGPEVWHHSENRTALRFPDPEGRQDESGRVIPHDVVLLDVWAAEIGSFEVGRDRVWREVGDEFAAVWDKDTPPPPRP